MDFFINSMFNLILKGMNKKFLFGMFAAATMLFATSCSDEIDSPQSGNEVIVSFAIGLENGTQTRAISDGTSADKLVYAVYDVNGNLIAPVGTDINSQFVKEDAFENLKETVSITLAKGQEYTVAFWAQDASCTAYTTTDLENIGVSYGGDNNDESRDAFFATTTFTVTGNASIDVTLKRPFAQLNVGVTTKDWEAAVASGLEVKTSSVIVKNAGTSLNLLTGAVSGETEAKFKNAVIPNDPSILTVGIDADNNGEVSEEEKVGYHWISMSYILVADGSENGKAKTTADVCFTFNPAVGKGQPITLEEGLDAVPLQRNWRTNILGKLLTGDIEFNVVIDPNFDNDHNILNGSESTNEIAEGVSYANGVFSVYTAEGMKWLADQSNADTKHELIKDAFAGQTIEITQDIDMTGIAWTPFGQEWKNAFTGTFNGNGNTISNLTVAKPEKQLSVGLFGNVINGGLVQNVILSNVNVTGNAWTGAIVGQLYGASVLNCTVKDSKITDEGSWGRAGAVAGLITNATIEGCSVTNTDVVAISCVGGLTGVSTNENNKVSVLKDNTLLNVNVIADQTVYNRNDNAGELIGQEAKPATKENNKIDNVTVSILEGQSEVYEVAKAEDLFAVAALINSGKDFSSKTIMLIADIDLGGKNWEPINLWNPEKVLLKEIDGNEKTISNMTVKGASNIGFIGQTAGTSTLTIKNLTFTNPTVETTGSIAGAVIGYQYGDVTLTNVTVSGGNFSTTADKGINLGGLIGFSALGDGAKLTLTGCKVENSVFKGFHTVAGLVGKIPSNDMSSSITECQSINNTFYYSDTRDRNDADGAPWSEFYNQGGYKHGTVASSCTSEGNKGINQIVEGLVRDSNDGSFAISSANGLVYASANIFTATGTKVVNIMNDIDMTGVSYTPTHYNTNTGALTINGNNNSIVNLSVDGGVYAALLGRVSSTLMIKDLTIKDSEFAADNNKDGEYTVGAFIGWAATHGDDTKITLENCKAENVKYGSTKYVGGLVGYQTAKPLNITNCVVKGAQMTSEYTEDNGANYKGHVGGLIGYYSAGIISGSSVVESAITVKGPRAGAIVGTAQADAVIGTGNIVDNVTISDAKATSENIVGAVDNRTNKDNTGVTVK